jgi:anti-sigma-K factor RskA
VSGRIDHDEIESLLALRALGGAGAEDEGRLESAMAEHAPCETCRTLEQATSDAAGRLAFALPPRPVSSAFEERVLAEARGTREVQRTPARVPRSALRTVAVAAVVAIVAFAAGWGVRGSTSDTSGPLAGVRVAPLDAAEGSMAFAFRPGDRGALLFGSHVAAPANGRVYELWLIRGGTPIRQGCFAPANGGTVVLAVRGAVRSSDTAAVTLESDACPAAPTTTPIAATPLGNA